MKIRTIVIFLFIFQITNSIGACPLGTKEDHLTLQRVMRNFGRFIMPAEMIAYRSLNKYEDISNQQIEEAIGKLSLLMSCAQAVIDDPKNMNLLPLRAQKLTSDQLVVFKEDFIFFMQEFNDNIAEYQNLFIKILIQEKNIRNFDAIYKQTKDQDVLIERAHKKLME